MFEFLKGWMQRRTEKDCVKSQIQGETVYLKKGSIFTPVPIVGKKMKEWSQVYPAVNEDGSWNLINTIFGGWRNLFKLLVLFALLALAYSELGVLLGDAKEYMSDEYVIVERESFNKFCQTQLITQIKGMKNNEPIDFPELT